MAKRQQSQESKGGPCVRQAAELGRILNDLQSPDAGTRAEAVRTLCPCRTQWDVPVQRYVSEMMNDPSSTVRHEAHHVLDEDSGWGKRLAARRLHAELKAEQANGHGDAPGPHSLAWRRQRRPMAKGAAARMTLPPPGRRR
jgi:hypothetical protein